MTIRNTSPARVNLGLTYFTMGRRADALSEWQQILDIEPTNKSAAMYIAMVSHMPAAEASKSDGGGGAGPASGHATAENPAPGAGLFPKRGRPR